MHYGDFLNSILVDVGESVDLSRNLISIVSFMLWLLYAVIRETLRIRNKITL